MTEDFIERNIEPEEYATEARWCPMARAYDSDESGGATATNRPLEYDGRERKSLKCIGTRCMAWRTVRLDDEDDELYGYCGLAPLPSIGMENDAPVTEYAIAELSKTIYNKAFDISELMHAQRNATRELSDAIATGLSQVAGALESLSETLKNPSPKPPEQA